MKNILTHPCKVCLVRPVCQDKCKIFKKYFGKLEMTLSVTFILSTDCLIGAFVYIINSIFPYLHIPYWFPILLYLASYIYTYEDIIQELKSIKPGILNLVGIIFCILIVPFIFPGIMIIFLIDSKLEKYKFSFDKK